MKHTILLAFVLMLLGGCKKEAEAPAAFHQVSGAWELEQVITYSGTTALAPGNGRLLVLQPDGMMESRHKDTVLYRGRYYLQQKADCRPREDNLYFTTSDSAFLWQGYIRLTSNQLVLSSSNCLADGGTTIFRRVE